MNGPSVFTIGGTMQTGAPPQNSLVQPQAPLQPSLITGQQPQQPLNLLGGNLGLNANPARPGTIGLTSFTGALGDLLVDALIRQGNATKMMELALNPITLHEPERPRYQYLMGYVRKYGSLPTRETYIRETGHTDLPTATEPPGFYADKIRERFTREGISSVLLKFSNDLKVPGVTGDALLTSALSDLLGIRQATVSNGIYDLRGMNDRVMAQYQHTATHDDDSIHLGWDTIDRMATIRGGEILSVVGRPGQGKTWLMLYMALNAWLTQKKRTMFVTTEMIRGSIEDRIASMIAHIPVKGLMKASLATPQMKKLQEKMFEISNYDTPMWIVDATAGVTVQDLWAHCSVLGVEWLVIDGAYLMHHPDRRLDRSARVADNCRLMKKDLASGLMIPVAASWQFNREMSKRKNAKGKRGGDEKPTIDDIGYSDEIGQISTVVMGLLEADTVETIQRRRIDLLKGRNGETGGFFVNYNFVQMDFSEHHAPTVDGMQFV